MDNAKPQLTSESLSAFLDGKAEEIGGTGELIRDVHMKGFATVIEEQFQLSDAQQARLDAMRSTPRLEQLFDQVFVFALVNGGRIGLVGPIIDPIPQDATQSTDVHVGIGVPGVGTIDVDVHCE